MKPAAAYRRAVAQRFDPVNLVGSREIADRLGAKSYAIVDQWRRRYPDFPEPLAIVSGVRVWNWPDVQRWAKATGRA